MRNTTTRAAAGAITSAVAVLATVIVATPAQARCVGQQAVTHERVYDGHVVAREKAISGTCDGDGIYNGQLQDVLTDGYAARVRFSDGSFNQVVAYAYTTAWDPYQFIDKNGDISALFQIYSSPASRPSVWTGNGGY